MESFQKPVTFMYFWLNYFDKNYIERISVAVKDIDHLFNMTSEIIEADNLHLILFSVGTRIDYNGCLERFLEMPKWLLFGWLLFFKITSMFIEAVISSTSLVLLKVYFNSLYI